MANPIRNKGITSNKIGVLKKKKKKKKKGGGNEWEIETRNPTRVLYLSILI